MNDPFLSQAACAAVQIAIVDLLASWNILPSHVLGHSSGEIAAAYCAGHLTREDAWKLAYFRGFVSIAQTDRRGGMAAIGISADGIQPYLDAALPYKTLTIACYNSPKSITISGDEDEIDKLCDALEKDGVFARKLAVRNAYHSSHMEAVADDYLSLIGNLSNSEKFGKDVEMISSVTGEVASGREVVIPTYWVQNLVMPVRFTGALLAMTSGGMKKSGQRKLRVGSETGRNSIQHIVEIGPHSALRTAIRDTLSTKKETAVIEYHNVITRNFDDIATALSAAATLYCHSYPVSLDALNSQIHGSREPRMLTDLPPYAFNHTKTYWKDSRLSKNFRSRQFPRHDLFGAPVADWNPAEPRWRGFLRVAELPWLKDHKVRSESNN
jgi:acyl transferase domain-containing protein